MQKKHLRGLKGSKSSRNACFTLLTFGRSSYRFHGISHSQALCSLISYRLLQQQSWLTGYAVHMHTLDDSPHSYNRLMLGIEFLVYFVSGVHSFIKHQRESWSRTAYTCPRTSFPANLCLDPSQHLMQQRDVPGSWI